MIDESGEILAESRYDKYKMENHLKRPEIQTALSKRWGESIRYSKTLKEDFLYVAKRLKDENILRMAYSLSEIKRHFYSLWLKFLAIFLLFIVLSVMVSYVISSKIKAEMGLIVGYVKALANKNYDKTFKVGFAKEFEVIGKNLKNLAKRLKKRDDNKKKFTKKLKKINRERSELISAIGHEFKNPIAIISGYTQTLLEDELSPALRKEFLKKIYKASEKISDMIDRLSFAIKFESGMLTPKKERFDICIVIKEAVNFLKSRYPGREIEVNCEKYEVNADKKMIESVILNLLDNALKYSDSLVSIEASNGVVKVKDRGIGIKEEDIEKITKRFYRVGNSWDNSMGLGLYIVKYILKLHNNKLEIKSKYGEGSEFSFRLGV